MLDGPKVGIGLAALSVLLGCVMFTPNLDYGGAPRVASQAAMFSGRVTRVVDGDTFWIRSASERNFTQ